VRIVIAGGGTAGHVFPAIALAQELARSGDAEVRFLGTSDGLEARSVPEAGFVFTPIQAEPLARKLSWATARAPVTALRSVVASRPLVRDADVVVGMGGYVSLPPVLAARWSRRPVVLHEQNAVPGLANKVVARQARAVALSFADAAVRLPHGARTVVTGNPVRERILEVPANRDALRKEAFAELDLEADRFTVLVFGGSLGALHVDRTVSAALHLLRDRADLQLLVLTGPDHLELVAGPAREPMALRVRALAFLDRMELGYAAADAVVARAGATSVAELAVCGLPSLLIPYPHATANHQEANARELERAGAAEVLLDAALEPADLASRIERLAGDPVRRRAMSAAATAWAKPDAAARLAAVVREAAG
jgi:UDP-N-acetylglucosamine--N-acetylmuramyl-(pentapeptide) pyrophosphoryl-undecaprenol N-acetylglucosamine transferase